MGERPQHTRRAVGDKTVSDIDEMIAEWCSRMRSDASLTRQELDELEDHFRAVCGSVLELGLSTDEAFLVAKHRLGRGETLSEEFAKISPLRRWRRRLQHLTAAILALPIIAISAWLAYEQPTSLNPWYEPGWFEIPWLFVLPPLVASVAILVNGVVGALLDYRENT